MGEGAECDGLSSNRHASSTYEPGATYNSDDVTADVGGTESDCDGDRVDRDRSSVDDSGLYSIKSYQHQPRNWLLVVGNVQDQGCIHSLASRVSKYGTSLANEPPNPTACVLVDVRQTDKNRGKAR